MKEGKQDKARTKTGKAARE